MILTWCEIGIVRANEHYYDNDLDQSGPTNFNTKPMGRRALSADWYDQNLESWSTLILVAWSGWWPCYCAVALMVWSRSRTSLPIMICCANGMR